MPNKSLNIFTWSLLVFLGLISSCQQKKESTSAQMEILDILRQERKAHVEKDAGLFFSRFDKDFILVNKGEVSTYDSVAYRQHFDQYLHSSDFIKWDDVNEPVIKISDDGSMAYAIVEKLVIIKNKSDGDRIDTTHFAWVSIFRKKDEAWKLVCNASTNK